MRVVAVAILTVRASAAAQFHAYERHAAAVMAAHGGRVERCVRVADPADGADGEHFREIHLLAFPDAQAFAAYRADPRLAEQEALREASVLHTELHVGEDGPRYDPV